MKIINNMERYYTSIEQSLHLHDLGLPQDTADMVYRNDYDVYTEENYICEIPEILPFEGDFLKNDVPCWSLGALLGVLEHPRCFQGDKPIYWFCGCFGKDNLYHEVEADNPVDSCYKMILELNKLELL